jgi:uncharacterized membrane protein
MWIFFGILAAFFVALKAICFKSLINDGLSSDEIIAFSFVFSGMISLIYLAYLAKGNKLTLPGVLWKKNMKWLLPLTFVTFTLAIILFDIGLSLTPNVAYMAALVSLNILFLYFYSWYYLKQKCNKLTLLGVILLMLGIYLITIWSEL